MYVKVLKDDTGLHNTNELKTGMLDISFLNDTHLHLGKGTSYTLMKQMMLHIDMYNKQT